MRFQKVLITGGSKGIGLSLIKLLQKQAYEVHAVSRSIPDDPGCQSIHFHKCDLSSVSSSETFIDNFIETNGVPDLLINNAGSGAFFDWANFPMEAIDSQINLLFIVPVLFCRKISPLMSVKGSGTILNLSSLATLFPLPYMPLYNAGKSALSSFTQSMILECRDNPKFIDFRMGDVKTDFNNSTAKQNKNKWSEPMRRAWCQIEKQLINSPSSDEAARQIISVLEKGNAGCFYGGGWFHSRIAPILYKLVTKNTLNITLRKHYDL